MLKLMFKIIVGDVSGLVGLGGVLRFVIVILFVCVVFCCFFICMIKGLWVKFCFVEVLFFVSVLMLMLVNLGLLIMWFVSGLFLGLGGVVVVLLNNELLFECKLLRLNLLVGLLIGVVFFVIVFWGVFVVVGVCFLGIGIWRGFLYLGYFVCFLVNVIFIFSFLL